MRLAIARMQPWRFAPQSAKTVRPCSFRPRKSTTCRFTRTSCVFSCLSCHLSRKMLVLEGIVSRRVCQDKQEFQFGQGRVHEFLLSKWMQGSLSLPGCPYESEPPLLTDAEIKNIPGCLCSQVLFSNFNVFRRCPLTRRCIHPCTRSFRAVSQVVLWRSASSRLCGCMLAPAKGLTSSSSPIASEIGASWSCQRIQ
jgi:hypothetical protein